MSQDCVGSKNIEEVWEVGNCDPKVGAWLNLKLISHISAAPGRDPAHQNWRWILPAVGGERANAGLDVEASGID